MNMETADEAQQNMEGALARSRTWRRPRRATSLAKYLQGRRIGA
eukprot:CAMPEP_0181277858 /NCGR_PEP_ID=MMETSP1097-20121128/11370_1 /TAXON_ID=35684 /ORGANISM="Pseudopedinella elastica, Strain CCMP716" /LENGTH=43 /DNA_ID= /DNA_START= /DNA_END= /DNA_ORIENTATION=